MMNLVDLQDKIKGLSEQQLIREMQMPSGQMPQFLVLSEITRRQKMRDSFASEQGREQTTVAQDAVTAAGVPGAFAGEMAGAMAPQTDMSGNTGALPQQSAVPAERQPVMGMAGGGIVALQQGGPVAGAIPDPYTLQLFSPDRLSSPSTPDVYIPKKGGPYDGMATPVDLLVEMYNEQSDPRFFGKFRGRFFDNSRLGLPSYMEWVLRDAREDLGAPPRTEPGKEKFGRRGDDEEEREFDEANIKDLIQLQRYLDSLPESELSVQGRALRDYVPKYMAKRTGMAGGGIVAFQPGGLVSGRPQLVVMGGRQFVRMPDGSLEPLGSRLPGGVAAEARPMTGGVPLAAEGDISSLLPPAAGVGGALERAGDVELESALRDPALENAALDFDARRRELSGLGMAGLGAAPVAPMTPPGAELETDLADGEGLGRLGRLGRAWREALPKAEEATKNLAAQLGIDYEPGKILWPAAETPDTETPDTETTPPVDRPRGPGIASLGGAPGAPGAMSPFEQEIINLLDSREKRAEQDKWLALAQFGLQLMSSREPTIGGAIGEAGAPALATLRSGRESAEADRLDLFKTLEGYRTSQAQLELQRQAMAARAGARPPKLGITADEERHLKLLEARVAAAPTEAARLEASKEVDALRNFYLSRQGLGVAGAGAPGAMLLKPRS